MNERIKELSKEAETYARSICNPAGNYRNEETDEVKPFWRVSREKFAELIIQECITQVKLELNNRQLLLSNPPQNAGVWDACNNIRRHFGVKYER
jgi:hypothetical protein